jgi:hypothetical protein
MRKAKSNQPEREGFYWIQACDPVAPSCDWEIAYWSLVTMKWSLWGSKGTEEWSPDEITAVGPYIRSPDDTQQSRRNWTALKKNLTKAGY